MSEEINDLKEVIDNNKYFIFVLNVLGILSLLVSLLRDEQNLIFSIIAILLLLIGIYIKFNSISKEIYLQRKIIDEKIRELESIKVEVNGHGFKTFRNID